MDRQKAIFVLDKELSKLSMTLEKIKIVNKTLCESNADLENKLIDMKRGLELAKEEPENKSLHNLLLGLDTNKLDEMLEVFYKSDFLTMIISDYLNEIYELMKNF